MNSNNYADLVITSNAIFTGTQDKPILGGIAVKGNKIQAVCSKDDIKSFIGRETKIYDYKDQLVMPGFHDSHVHLILSGLLEDSASLLTATSEEECVKMVKEFADSRPNDEWVLGFSWYNEYWSKKELPTCKSLDRIIPDRPVFLLNAEGHVIWVNSLALKMCGVDKNTPDMIGGEIIRDSEGEPTGIFVDTAMGLICNKALDLPKEHETKLIKMFLKKAAAYGITSLGDIQHFTGVQLGKPEVYKSLEDNNELTARIHFSPGLLGDLERPKLLREKYKSEKVRFSGLKQLVDGVPTSYTGLMVEPYADKPGDCGTTFVNPDDLRKWVLEADKEGFRIRLHACGDGAVRLALDCFEEAQKVNGVRDSRHEIEHIEIIHPDDIGRFAKLGVICSVQPEHLALTEKFSENPYLVRLGEARSKLTWQFKTFMNTGAHIQFGSDYPVVDNNPMLEVYRGVTRLHNDGEPFGGWNPEEKLTVAELLTGYTKGSAYGAFRENDLGTLEVGKLADIAVLDRNLFEIPVSEIRDTKVKLTIMDGKIVYQD